MITLNKHKDKLIIIQNNFYLVKILIFYIPLVAFNFFTLFSLLHFRGFSDIKGMTIFITILCNLLSLRGEWKRKIYVYDKQITILKFPLRNKKIISLLEIKKIEIVEDELKDDYGQQSKKQITYKVDIFLEKEIYELCSSNYYEEIKMIKEKIYEYLGEITYEKK